MAQQYRGRLAQVAIWRPISRSGVSAVGEMRFRYHFRAIPAAALVLAWCVLMVAPDLSRAGVVQPEEKLSSGLTPPTGRWVGTAVEVDWLGNALAIERIELRFHDAGKVDIAYPSLGCTGYLTRTSSSKVIIEYRETIITGADKCPSGAAVALEPAGDRWVFNWTLSRNWLKVEEAPSEGLPPQVATAPDAGGVMTGILTSVPAMPRPFFKLRKRDTTATERRDRIEEGIVPPVVVEGEKPQESTLAGQMRTLHVPGVSVAVIYHGRIDWAQGYGVTRVGGRPVNTRTLFQAASISKPVTGFMVLRLAAEHRLDLDADVNGYLEGWKVPASRFMRRRLISLRGLLTHTAGMSVHGFAGYLPGAQIPTLPQILNGRGPANSAPIILDAVPGSQWSYSGGGYVIIRNVLQDVSHTSFPRLARELVFDPLGMSHSTFAQPLPTRAMNNAASPYGSNGQALVGGPHIYPELAPDGLWSTPSDLARFALEIAASYNGRPKSLLSRAESREMLEPGGLANWGLGVGVGGTSQNAYFWHSGSNAGYQSMLFAYDRGDGAVVMTNSDSGERLIAKLVRTIAYEYGWPDYEPYEISNVPLTTYQLDRLCGHYRLGRYAVLTIRRERDRLYARTRDKPEIPMYGFTNERAAYRIYPKSPRQWFAIDPDGFTPNPDIQITFRVENGKGATGLVIRENDADTVASKLSDRQARELSASLAARVQSQREASGDRATLRNYLGQLVSGRPDYTRMSPSAAYVTRLLLLSEGEQIQRLGAVRQLTFKGVSGSGANRYVITFQNGVGVAEILCDASGQIEFVLLSSPVFV